MPVTDAKRVQISSQLDFLKLALFTTVAAGQTSALQLPKFWNYFVFWIQLNKSNGVALTDAEIASALSEVRILIDGTPYFRLSAAQIQMINAFYTSRDTPVLANQGMLPIYLAREWMFDLPGKDEPAWGASGLNSMSVEFDQAGGGLAASATLYAEVGPAAPLGRFISILPYTLNALGSGESPVFNVLPIDPDQSLYCWHLAVDSLTPGTPPYTTYFSILPDGRTPLIDKVPLAVWNQTLRKNGLTPQAGYTHLCMVRRGRHADALPLGDPNMTVTPSFTAAPGGVVSLAEIALER